MSIEALELARNFIKFNTGSSHYVIEQLDQAIADFEKQEPFGYVMRDEIIEQLASVNCGTIYRLPAEGRSPLYTHPQPKREWVGLTDEEIDGIVKNTRWHELIKATEAKLKEKNA